MINAQENSTTVSQTDINTASTATASENSAQRTGQELPKDTVNVSRDDSEAQTATDNGDSTDPLSVGYKPPWAEYEEPDDDYEIVDESEPSTDDKSGKFYGAIFRIKDNKGKPINIRISGVIWLTAFTHTNESTGWGMQLAYVDLNGKTKTLTCARQLLHDQHSDLITLLVTSGFEIVPGQERQLLKYLGAWKPGDRLTCATKLGWLDDSFTYVLPSGAIGKNNIVFQPEKNIVLNRSSAGTLLQWQQHVAIPISKHNFGLFILCHTFVGTLLKFAGQNSFGLHIYERTSRGKTTLLQISASAWGKGSDPAHDPHNSFIKRWNMTANAAEALAAASNDGPLDLDELGANTIKDALALIYNMFGGRGKEAMNSDRSMKATRGWLMTLLSSGEIPISQKIIEAGQQLRGGQGVRFYDLRLELPMTRQEVDALKEACGTYYGLSGPLFIRKLIEHFKDAAVMRKSLTATLDKWVIALIDKRQLLPEHERAAKCFALIGIAGAWAREFKILPADADVFTAVKWVYDNWLDSEAAFSDSMRGVLALRDFLLSGQQGRFLPYPPSSTSPKILNVAGYRDEVAGIFYLTGSGFREAVKGYDILSTCKELEELELMTKHQGRYQVRITVGNTRPWVYQIPEKIFDLHNPISGETTETCETEGAA